MYIFRKEVFVITSEFIGSKTRTDRINGYVGEFHSGS